MKAIPLLKIHETNAERVKQLIPCVLLCSMGASYQAFALTDVATDTQIGSSSPVNETYRVHGGATLTASGAQTGSISLGLNSADQGFLLLQQGSAVSGNISTQPGSFARITSSTISGDVSIGDSGTISGSSVGGVLSVLGNASATDVTARQLVAQRGEWTVTRGRIEGASGTGFAGFAGSLGQGSLNATDSVFSGAGGFLLFNGLPGTSTQTFRVDLISSQVTAGNSPAFQVGDGASNLQGIYQINLSDTTVSSAVLLDVVNQSDAELNASTSNLTGNIQADSSSQVDLALQNNSTLRGALTNVNSLQVDNSDYVVTGDSTVGSLALNNGRITFNPSGGASLYTLTANTLSGNGSFLMNTRVSDETADFLNVTGNASGVYTIYIRDTGTEPAASGSVIPLIETGGGDATFSLNRNTVEIGAWKYHLVEGENTWGLSQAGIVNPETPVDPENPVDPGESTEGPTPSSSADVAINMGSAYKNIFYGELNALTGQINALRTARHNGVWLSYLGGRQHIQGSWDTAYRLDQSGYSFGGSVFQQKDAGWLGSGIYMTNTWNNVHHASGGVSDVTSTGLGGFVSWDTPSGWYSGLNVKMNYYDTSLDGQMADGGSVTGSEHAFGYGARVEGGHVSSLPYDMSLTPYISLTGYRNQDRTTTYSNGMIASTGDGASLQGESGVRLSKDMNAGNITMSPYISAAYVWEFVKSQGVDVNREWRFANDGQGGSGKFGAGISAMVTKDWTMWAQLDYQHGEKIESPIQGSAGVAIRF